jgi:hypothetical protein
MGLYKPGGFVREDFVRVREPHLEQKGETHPLAVVLIRLGVEPMSRSSRDGSPAQFSDRWEEGEAKLGRRDDDRPGCQRGAGGREANLAQRPTARG